MRFEKLRGMANLTYGIAGQAKLLFDIHIRALKST